MSQKYTPGSFTKNFSWNLSYVRLHDAIRSGFRSPFRPVKRNSWRSNSGIPDRDRQLVPLNFFLYSIEGLKDDFVMADQLVDATFDPYDDQFAQLSLFAFHLATSGHWKNSPWPDGRVAGWANRFIKEFAWSRDDWDFGVFEESALFEFIKRNVFAEPVTLRKVYTNYRYMLTSAGVLSSGGLQSNSLRQRWFVDAVQLFWDREIFGGFLLPSSNSGVLIDALIDKEIFKLLRCGKDQCAAFGRAAYGEFSQGQANDRIEQINNLRSENLIAA